MQKGQRCLSSYCLGVRNAHLLPLTVFSFVGNFERIPTRGPETAFYLTLEPYNMHHHPFYRGFSPGSPKVCTLKYTHRSDCCNKFERQEGVKYNTAKLYQYLVSCLGIRVDHTKKPVETVLNAGKVNRTFMVKLN